MPPHPRLRFAIASLFPVLLKAFAAGRFGATGEVVGDVAQQAPELLKLWDNFDEVKKHVAILNNATVEFAYEEFRAAAG